MQRTKAKNNMAKDLTVKKDVRVHQLPNLQQNPSKFPVKVIQSLEVDFPAFLEFEGKSFYITGKTGIDMATGTIPAAEYCDHNDISRVWMNIYGVISNG